ncbi:MAG: tetratricopeptide repeat protein [Hyphomonadaceae bacterium]
MLRAGALALGVGLAACATGPGAPAPASRAYADFLIGRVASARADYAAASDRYFAALARSPHDEAMIDGALIASLASGDVERAQRAARLAPRADGAAYAHIVRAADDLGAQRWESAVNELDQVQGTAAEQLVAQMLAVWARVGEGREDGVIESLAPLAAIRPYGGLFAYQQAMALDYGGRQQEARTAYENAAQGGLWLPTGISRHANLLLRLGEREQALALLSQETNLANPALAAERASIESGGRDNLPRLTPARGAAAGLYGLSAIFRQEHDTADGLAALTLALILDPDFDGARLSLAQQQSELGHIDQARATLAQIGSASPYALSARLLETWMTFDSGDHEAALAMAQTNAAGGNPQAQRSLADMYRNVGRYAEAEPIFTSLIAQQPDSWRYYFARGATRERLGRWPEAEADLRRALELSPNQPDVLNYLGYYWVDRGEHLQEGLAMVRRAAELRPMSGAIIDSLGWAYFRLGDFVQAVDWLEAAVRLEPADPTLNDHLGDAYWRLGRRIEARFQWERALTLHPDDPDAVRAKLNSGLPDLPPAQAAAR